QRMQVCIIDNLPTNFWKTEFVSEGGVSLFKHDFICCGLIIVIIICSNVTAIEYQIAYISKNNKYR
ncbi:hypothetical protein L9F63_011844, partial [Diploptera punctata]